MLNSEKKLGQLIESGLKTLLLLMPFHAFLAIYLGHLFGHQALWQAWKELLLVLVFIATILYLYLKPSLRHRLITPVNLAAAIYIFIALLVSLLAGVIDSKVFWFGIKTDLVFIIVFLISQAAASDALIARFTKIFLIVSTVVATLAAIQALILPPSFLVFFGYGPDTIRPVQLIDPAVKAVRAFSTLGGPNQLGAFMIIPISTIVYFMFKSIKWWQPLALISTTMALILSHSRSAWIGTILAVIIVIVFELGKKGLAVVGGLLLIGLLGLLLIYPRLPQMGQLQYYLLHSNAGPTSIKTSNPLHLEAVINGVATIKQHPAGLGLGAAGPASFRGDSALIPENYYLQIALESGLLGLMAFLVFLFLVAVQLFRAKSSVGLAIPLLASLAGISFVNLLLHGWADSTLAYVYWILAGVVIGQGNKLQDTSNKQSSISNKQLSNEN